MTHALKTLPEYFALISAGQKNFEMRKLDRPFTTGDKLLLQEFTGEAYTGREIELHITDVAHGEEFLKLGLKKGFCIISFRLQNQVPALPPQISQPVGLGFNGALTDFAKEVILSQKPSQVNMFPEDVPGPAAEIPNIPAPIFL